MPTDWVTSSNGAVTVGAFKVAAALGRKVCLRLYESLGGYANTTYEQTDKYEIDLLLLNVEF